MGPGSGPSSSSSVPLKLWLVEGGGIFEEFAAHLPGRERGTGSGARCMGRNPRWFKQTWEQMLDGGEGTWWSEGRAGQGSGR